MDSPNPSSMRVLTRPPNLTPTQPTLTPPIPPNQTDHQSNGVVVVGFIGRRSTDVTQLINRVVDANVFGSGKLDKDLGFQKGDGDWFKCRRISYYDDDENGILYLQFSSTVCPAMEEVYDSCSSSSSSSGFDSVLEEREFGDLQGMLFMFSVCHVIIFIQEGSRFDTQILKRLRILQSAKHAMAPFNKSQTTPPSTSSSHSSSSRSSVSGVSFNNRSPGRSGVILSRNASAISIRSGLGSYTSLFPGQCTPVILFVFLDDFSDINTGTSNTEETIDTSSLNQSSSLSNLARTSLPPKGSAPVVVLARPVNKSECGFKKKLQSSLEAQIRFSIKKCRTLAGSETSHAGSRSGAISNSAPLFSLDASKAVALLDIYSNQSGKSLDFVTRLVEDVLNGKATSDSLLLETHSQSAIQEDIVSVKEFIYRQADILRGRGGVASNANSGSAAGVGMVAVAAAAAAASAASGKAFTAPELPSVDIWVSSSLRILQGILSAESGLIIESESSKRNLHQKNTVEPAVEGVVSRVTENPLQTALSCLESGKGFNTKFSTLWCQRALPSAKEVYLSDLPACYPTSKHEVQLEKALRAFCSMVKGPAVPLYMKQLEEECTSIWSSGRQLCDAVSLTGKPCMHQRHDVETDGLVSIDVVKPHSSGFVFLKACACGRSRLLQSDPFDFETANITSSYFADCDKLLPSLQLPQVKNVGPIQPSSWNLVRVGGAKYYNPSKGLLQSGFCATQKFLLKWKIVLEKPKNQHDSLSTAVRQGSVVRLGTEHSNGSITGGELKNPIAEELQSGNNMQRDRLYENNQTDEKKLSFGRGIPSFTMRKPFSEVVAGSAAAISGFPPLQSRKQLSVGSEKSTKQSFTRDRVAERVHHTADNQGSQQSKDISAVQDAVNGSEFGVNRYREGNPILQIGSNVVPVNMSSCQKIGLSDSSKNGTAYVGFEHECPRGHRFILTTEHLKELCSPYSLSEESHIPSSIENSDNKRPDSSKLGRNGTHGKAHRNSNRMNGSAVRKVKNMDKTKEIAVDSDLDGKQQTRSFIGMPTLNESVKDSLHSVSIDDGVFSLLNRSLPIYMNCPHCRTSKNKKENPKIKFAGTMSQLQRIFLVTPPFPVVLATCPVVQFEVRKNLLIFVNNVTSTTFPLLSLMGEAIILDKEVYSEPAMKASCLPPSVPDREQKLQFTFGCPVILPPESFLSLRLPFVYGVRLEDGSLQSFRPFEHQPEATAWIAEGTTLQVISKGSTMFDGSSENLN